jgi:hypothetical protein
VRFASGDFVPFVPTKTDVRRRELHLRTIEMRGYEREDGLYDIEGRVCDRKTSAFQPPAGNRVVDAGEAVHDMWLRLTVDEDLVVRDIASVSDATPYPTCRQGGANLSRMVGVRIAGGWTAEVKRRLGGAASCTHLMELLIPLGTAAFQTLAPIRLARPDRLDAVGRPVKIDSCHAYSSAGALVARRWPAFHTGNLPADEVDRQLAEPSAAPAAPKTPGRP